MKIKCVKPVLIVSIILFVFIFIRYTNQSDLTVNAHVKDSRGTVLSNAAATGHPSRVNELMPQTTIPFECETSADVEMEALVPTLISPSQMDTEIDGQLREDGEGNLIVDIGVRDLFDYFFSSLGEKSPEQIALNLERYIDSNLSPKAAVEARALLRRFMAYNQDLAEYAADDSTDIDDLHGQALVDHLKTYQDFLADSRERHFGEEYSNAFFNDEGKYQAYNIARLELGLSDLSDDEKQQEIEVLRDRLPEMQQKIIRSHERVNELMDNEKIWQEADLSEDELYGRRVTAYGYDAAERMTVLDKKNRVWQSRLSDFFDDVDQINATNWPDADKKDLIDEIKISGFSETERLRVNVIERYRQKNINNKN